MVDAEDDDGPGQARVDVGARTAYAWHEAEQVRDQDEEEDRADEREELPVVMADGLAPEVCQTLDDHLDHVAQRDALVGQQPAVRGGETSTDGGAQADQDRDCEQRRLQHPGDVQGVVEPCVDAQASSSWIGSRSSARHTL